MGPREMGARGEGTVSDPKPRPPSPDPQPPRGGIPSYAEAAARLALGQLRPVVPRARRGGDKSAGRAGRPAR